MFSHLWTRLKLTTLSEELGNGRRNLHCRIRSAWSLLAKVLMTCLVLAVTLSIVNFAAVWPWTWMSLVLLPLALWIIDDQAAHDTHLLLTALRDVASEKHLAQLD